MTQSFFNEQDVSFTSSDKVPNLELVNLNRDEFLWKWKDSGNQLQPELTASWERSKSLKIDPYMQELSQILSPQEYKALMHDKKTFVDLAQSNFYTLLPLLNMPRTALCVQDKDGTFLELSDHDQLLNLNLTRGSIWREETVGTSSTSLCLESGKIVQLPGPLHYCKALDHQLATTTPICDSDGNRLGLITIVNHVNEGLRNTETVSQILYWVSAMRVTLEKQLSLLKRSYAIGENIKSADNRKQLADEHTMPTNYFSGILGESIPIKKSINSALRFAQTDCSILLTGESGTGKELFAQAIHQISRGNKPFVAINCAAIPANLMASELFGYVGGAFTGADNKGRLGKIELAQDGSLFLDEIGEMPLEIQAIFLRVLEDKNVMRLGGNKDVHVDFRLIAATNKDLYQMVQENKFRADLYYRLEMLQLVLPPLRDRGRDILLIANRFLEEACSKMGRSILKLSKDAEMFMLNYDWPGNVRQLKNAIFYAANMCQGQIITPQDLPASVYRNMTVPLINGSLQADQPLLSSRETEEEPIPAKNMRAPFQPLSPLREMEQESIEKTLLMTGNNVIAASKILGLSKSTIYRKLKKYNITI
jgi:Transcriptional regulator containing PAS, AAA-type ATPase, and DNA-binding domains